MLNKGTKIISKILQVLAAVIMLQTLFFKFTGAPESVYIFSTIGMEPFGRYGVGTMELIASLLILWPGTVWLGALMGIGLMAGAVFFHLTSLGIEVANDGGYLFALSLTVMLSCVIVLLLRRKEIPLIKTA